jgi:5-formyltetrahydrofolate cyclo-ligase
MSKINLRNQLLKIRNNISPTKRLEWSQKICQNILRFNPFINATHIAIYHNKAEEVDIKYLLEHTEQKQFYLPVLQENWQLRFFKYHTESSLITNKWNILEPISNTQDEILIDKLDIIFLPLLGFDRLGNRLGMGKGCYDRSIPKNHKSILIGIGFSSQEYESIPHEPHDIKLNYVITEENIFHFPENSFKLT